MKHIDLFSGIGGFALAAQWAGFETVLFCDNDKFCQKVLKRRFNGQVITDTQTRGIQTGTEQSGQAQDNGRLDNIGCDNDEGNKTVPIYGDIRDVDGTKYRGATLLTGGFPCQPFSCAGKRKGKEDDRYLWPEMLQVINEAQPRWVIGENVAGIVNMALGQVLSDLESIEYEVQPLIIPACAVNAPHRRDRVWIVAHSQHEGYIRRSSRSTTDRNGVEEDEQERQVARGAVARCYENATDTGSKEPKRVSSIKREKSISGRKHNTDVTNSQSRQSREQTEPEGREDIGGGDTEVTTDTTGSGEQGEYQQQQGQKELGGQDGGGFTYDWDKNWIEVATELCGVDDGLPAELDGFKLSKSKHREERLKSLGNAIVPQIAYKIIKIIADYEV